jgi:hypothetical protein
MILVVLNDQVEILVKLLVILKKRTTSKKENEFETGHRINWDDWSILTKNPVSYRLKVRESLFITLNNPSLNRTTASVPLVVFPDGIQPTKPKVKIKLVNQNHRGRVL